MTSAIPRGGLMALDWGQKKVGYATVDELGLVVTPCGHFRRKDFRETWILSPTDIAELRALVERYEPGALVLGLPLNADGSVSEASQGAERLAEQLRKAFETEVHLIDETLTSWNSKGSHDEDAEAAAQLLRDWVFQNKAKGELL